MSLTVYVLQHVRMEDEFDDVKFIGVYSSNDAALGAIERLRDKPGFRDSPDGFHIDLYVVDVDNWSEGFGVPHE